MTRSEFLDEFRRILEMEHLDESDDLGEGGLDSVVVLSLLALIDEGFGISVPAQALAESKTPAEVIALIEHSGGQVG